MDRERATKLLIEAEFPLLTLEIQDAMAALRLPASPPSSEATDLWRKFPYHFSNYFYEHTDGDRAERIIVTEIDGWTFTEVHRELLRALLLKIHKFKKSLNNLDAREFLVKYRDYLCSQQINKEKEAKERDESRFFMFPEADLDGQFWHALPCWTVEEATAVLLQKNPRVVNTTTLQTSLQNEWSPFFNLYNDVKLSLDRALECGVLKLPLTPASVAKWADIYGVGGDRKRKTATDEELQVLRSQNEELNKRLEAYESNIDSMNPKARRSYFLLILAMACGAYKHKIGVNSHAITKIVESARTIGIGIGNDTIRSILDDAEDYARDHGFLETIKRRTGSL